MSRTFVARVVMVALLGHLAAPASAQPMLPIAVDQRVRIWTAAADAVTGRVVAITVDTVQVAEEGHDPVTVVSRTVRRVEVSRGVASRGAGFKKGAVRGAIVLAAIGALSLGLQHDSVGEDGSSVGGAVALGAFSGALFGALVGGAIGAARSGDEWQQVFP